MDQPAPKRPVTAFWCFMTDFRKELAGIEPEVDFHTIVKLGGQKWRGMSYVEKQPYMEQHFEEKLRYTNSMHEYKRANKRAWKITKPKQPPTAFQFFMSDFSKEMAGKEMIKGRQPMSQLGRIRWKEMSEDEKRPYESQQFEAKLRYSHSMEKYRLALENDDDEDDDDDDEEDEDFEESRDPHLQKVRLKDGIYIKEEAPVSKYKANSRKQYSPVWDYFDLTDDKRNVVCKLCSQEISMHSSSNQSLFRHLRSEHIDVDMNPLSVTMPASRLNGDLWSSFEVIQDTKLAKCKICRNVFSFRTTSGNLRRHLRRTHKGKDVSRGALLPHYEFGEEEENEEEDRKPVARKRVPRKRKSRVWNYFKIIDKTKAACTICNKALGYTSSLLTMKVHLQKRHGISIPRKEQFYFPHKSSNEEVEGNEEQLMHSSSEEEADTNES